MKNRILLLIALGFCLTTNAQYSKAAGGAFSLGMQTLDAAPMRQFYTEAPSLSEINFSFSGYLYYQFGSVIAGFSGGGAYGGEVEDANNNYYLSGGYATLDLGYKIINKNNWAVYPVLQAGICGASYSINNKETVTVGSEIAQFNSVDYSWNNFAFGGSLRVERYFRMKEDCEGAKGGGLIGLEAGYLTSPSSSEWYTASRAVVVGGPDYKFNSFFVRLTIGGFGGN